MNKWITAAVLTVLACHIGNALECYVCDYGTCSFPTKKPCGALEVCLTEQMTTGPFSLKKKSCSLPTNCLGDSEMTYGGIKVTTTPSCCPTHLCNSAAIPSASLLTTIAILISLWMARL
ncbi:hypothetical protein GDO81_003095 [Engystomops pustulosus]|uniref:UPAR/Ly6 domain-containing protein n=1 Tax=Engystomops pustulosus TaxID=76066 RepID=A0AAV6ZU75_ENGPU|nr:hypothetical protein GDO81_003095 [Engystomops pustulosus]